MAARLDVLSVAKNLERIADHATNIAERALSLNKRPPVKSMVDLPRILNLARAMVSDGARHGGLRRGGQARDDMQDARRGRYGDGARRHQGEMQRHRGGHAFGRRNVQFEVHG